LRSKIHQKTAPNDISYPEIKGDLSSSADRDTRSLPIRTYISGIAPTLFDIKLRQVVVVVFPDHAGAT